MKQHKFGDPIVFVDKSGALPCNIEGTYSHFDEKKKKHFIMCEEYDALVCDEQITPYRSLAEARLWGIYERGFRQSAYSGYTASADGYADDLAKALGYDIRKKEEK